MTIKQYEKNREKDELKVADLCASQCVSGFLITGNYYRRQCMIWQAEQKTYYAYIQKILELQSKKAALLEE